MTKEELQNRIIEINQELKQTQANAVKLQGHLDEAHHWLSVMYKEEMEAVAEAPKEQVDGEVIEQTEEQAA